MVNILKHNEADMMGMNSEASVELAIRQVGIDVEQYPYKDVKVGEMIM